MMAWIKMKEMMIKLKKMNDEGVTNKNNITDRKKWQNL